MGVTIRGTFHKWRGPSMNPQMIIGSPKRGPILQNSVFYFRTGHMPLLVRVVLHMLLTRALPALQSDEGGVIDMRLHAGLGLGFRAVVQSIDTEHTQRFVILDVVSPPAPAPLSQPPNRSNIFAYWF